MGIQKKVFIFIVGFIVIGSVISMMLPKEWEKNPEAAIRIGAGDDISGVLMKEVAEGLADTYEVEDQLESSSFQDCWSNMAQWALSAEEINVAFYCSHIAIHTVEQNENVEIYGPTVMNAEVISYKEDWDHVSNVGISQGRELEKERAKKTYPQIERFQEITQKGILYSLEDGQVDAVIQDLTKAAMVPQYKTKPLSDVDYISYVLVVDKEFAKTKAFEDFLESYNQAVKKLNNPEYLADKLDVEASWIQEQPVTFLSLE